MMTADRGWASETLSTHRNPLNASRVLVLRAACSKNGRTTVRLRSVALDEATM